MNVLPWLVALLPWAASPADAAFRIVAAIGLVSLEMQVVTIAGVGSLGGLVPVNLLGAAVAAAWQATRRRPGAAWWQQTVHAIPAPALLAALGVVLALNAVLPFESADTYHLDRVAQIQRLGTMAYDPAADPKGNILGSAYELAVADIGAVPTIGPLLLRVHGVFGLGLYLLAIAAARARAPRARAAWAWALLLVIPVPFHQMVLLKNDLFVTIPAFVGLLWLVLPGDDEPTWTDVLRAACLVGFSVGCKPTNLPLALVLSAGVLLRLGLRWRPLAALAAGGIAGGLAGGVFLTLWQNARVYGDPFARAEVAAMGNVTTDAAHAALSVGRLAIGLVDLGILTPVLWPGRGGWGGTFGLPFLWALLVLVLYRHTREARWTAAIMAVVFVAFAATFPDADIAQRLALTPALLAVTVAIALHDRASGIVAPARLLPPVLLLSAAQVLRSAWLYWVRT
ncbi:MAG: hypothetical protein AB7G23_10890 [Vicinamibacterales bacterium]